MRGSYVEHWYEDKADSMWFLERAYLTLYQVDAVHDTEDEILAIHTEPSIDPKKPSGCYRRCPHLHVIRVPGNLHRAHLALEFGQAEENLASVATLTGALSRAVQMLSDEVLDRISF